MTGSEWGSQTTQYKRLDRDGNVVQPERQHTIGEKGCALTAMAMVLKALGEDYDPLTLNERMTNEGRFAKNQEGNWDGRVYWNAVNRYSSGKLQGQEPARLGSDENWTKKIPIGLSTIDEELQNGSFVIVQVANRDPRNPSSVRNHWVLITGKKDGKYQILDPGCYADRTTLDSYENSIYRAIICRRK
jgi:hypothetical protein